MDAAAPARLQHNSGAAHAPREEASMHTSPVGSFSNHGPLLSPKLLRFALLGGVALLYLLSLLVPGIRDLLGRIAEYLPR